MIIIPRLPQGAKPSASTGTALSPRAALFVAALSLFLLGGFVYCLIEASLR